MRLLIVVPRFVKNFGDFYQFPLGLAYVAAALKRAGHEVHGLNLNHCFGRVEELVAAEVKRLNIEACATGGLSPFLPEIQKVFVGARRGNPHVINIAGGGVVSSDPEVSPDIMDINIGVVGEGEVVICDALGAIENGRDLRDVRGIVYRNDKGAILRTANPDPVMDLTHFAWPDYELLGFGKHLHLQRPLDHHFFQLQNGNTPRAIDMISSRSCPYSCTFCFHPVGKVYRERPLDEFFAELEMLISKYGVNMVGILDELFSLRKERLLEFCKRIEPLKLQWMVQLHVHSADEHVLDAMRGAGCTYISYGIESMNEDVLRSMQKKTKRQRIHVTLERTFDRQIGIQGNLIFGDSAETLHTANETMSWWAHNRKYQVYLSRLQVYPGSPDYIMAVRDDMIPDRAQYANELPINLNISRLNDVNLDALSFQADIHGRTLLNVAPVKKFRPSRKQIEGRGIAYDIAWTCPRCDHVNNYEQCVLRPDHGNSIRVFCRSCRSRWDIKNHAASDGSKNESAILDSDSKPVARGGRSRAYTSIGSRISQLIARIHPRQPTPYQYQRQEDPVAELRLSGLAVADDPFEAARHLRFAEALTAIGALGAARLHLEQAVALDPQAVIFKHRLEALFQRADYADRGEIYFASFSDAPPPFRRSREAVEYNRKLEPAFPVYRRTANRESVEQGERKRLPIHFQ